MMIRFVAHLIEAAIAIAGLFSIYFIACIFVDEWHKRKKLP
jgi:hypothetical protein